MRRPLIVLAFGMAAALARTASADAPAPAPPPPPEVKYKLGSGFTLANGDDFTMQVTGRVQARYEYDQWDDDRDIPDVSRFTAERVRLGVKGSMFKVWKYEMEADFGKGVTSLKKGFISWEKYDAAHFEIGQFNIKFDRSNITSTAKQEFVDRSIAAAAFGHEYDIGMDVMGYGWDKKFQYNAGVFEGEKAPTPAKPNQNTGHAYVARISFNPNGDFGYGESDIRKTDYHLWYVDLAGEKNDGLWADANTDGKEDTGELTNQSTYAFGFGYKHAGVYFAGEYYTRTTSKNDPAVKDVDSDGWYAQFGYTFIRDKWEIAARYSELDPNHDKDDDVKTEWVLGVNRYLHGVGHALKFQTDFSWLTEEKAAPASDLHDFRIRGQWQVLF